MPKPKLIAIVGATATGKTDLAAELALRLNTEIISGDSMLIYKGFDIGTAKPTEKERRGVVHHLIDIKEPAEEYTVADFQKNAQEIIEKLNAAGKIPILAGGTGLYVKALLENYRFGAAGKDENYRAYLNKIYAAKGRDGIEKLLREKDAHSALRLTGGDVRRMMRALEAIYGGGSVARENDFNERGELFYDTFAAGLFMERGKLYEKINRRVDKMLAAGLIEETNGLLASGVGRNSSAMRAIGYRETAAFLAGEISRHELAEEIKKSTRHFAKRQITWYKKMPYIHWFNVEGKNTAELADEVLAAAGNFCGEKYERQNSRL